jgi:hypothetical protein
MAKSSARRNISRRQAAPATPSPQPSSQMRCATGTKLATSVSSSKRSGTASGTAGGTVMYGASPRAATMRRATASWALVSFHGRCGKIGAAPWWQVMQMARRA